MLFPILCFSLFLQILEFLLSCLNDDEMIAGSVALRLRWFAFLRDNLGLTCRFQLEGQT